MTTITVLFHQKTTSQRKLKYTVETFDGIKSNSSKQKGSCVEQIVVYRDDKGRSVFYRRVLGPIEATIVMLINKLTSAYGSTKKTIIEDSANDPGKLRCKDI